MIRRLKPRRPRMRLLGLALAAALASLAAAMLVTASAGEAAPKRSLQAPTNTSPPVISGTLAVGQTLSTTNGTWQSSKPILLYTYIWARCDADGNFCQNVPNATHQTYTLASADAGHAMRVYVTANNADGYTVQQSAATGVVLGAPQNTSPPTISGTPLVGETLTASTGSWQPSSGLTFTFLWGRCNSSGSDCSNITSARDRTYVPTNSDVGHTLVVYVTGNDSFGYTTAHSKPTAVVVSKGSLPKNTSPPTITGTAQVGQTLTAGVGHWSSPLPITSYAYLWGRCDSNGNNCANIGGATKATYTISGTDEGHRLVVYVTANTYAGFTTAHSAPTGIVGPALPPGAIRLGNGHVSVPASTVTLPARLVIDNLQFQPRRIQGRAPFVARFHVSDTRGYDVRGVRVYALGLPYSWVQRGVNATTDTNGWATMTIVPSKRLPIGRGHAIVMFVRALVPGQPVLAGSSTRRLVQITTAGRR